MVEPVTVKEVGSRILVKAEKLFRSSNVCSQQRGREGGKKAERETEKEKAELF